MSPYSKRALRRHHDHRRELYAQRVYRSWWMFWPEASNNRLEECDRQARRLRDNMRACSCDICKRYGGEFMKTIHKLRQQDWRSHDYIELLDALQSEG